MRFTVLAVVTLAGLAAAPLAGAQKFKVDKYDIKGEGSTDYVGVEAATGRVFVSRSTHMMVVDGATGKVLFDIPNTPGVHGAGIATRHGHLFTTNSGDETVSMLDLKTFAVIRQIKVGPGLDGIMYSWPLAPCEAPTGIAYDKATNRIFSGCGKTSVVVDATSGKMVAAIPNGTRVDALGWDPDRKLMFIPNGGEGNVAVVHQDSADKSGWFIAMKPKR